MALRSDIISMLRDLTPLFSLARRGVPEVVVSGLSYYKAEGKRTQGNDPAVVLTARGLVAPWQLLAADVAGEEAFWAVGLASHAGQPQQKEALQRLCAVAEAGEAELVCPRTLPLDGYAAAQLQASGQAASRLHHPAAGRHLALLAACRRHGYPVANYWDLEHPLQKRFAALIGPLLNEKPLWLTNSCGLPTLAITARAHLSLWERLARSEEPSISRLKSLWLRNIRLVGGNGRLEADIMEAAAARVLVKDGEDGLLVVTSLPSAHEATATCLIKLAGGYHPTYLALALLALLERTAELPAPLQLVKDYLRSRLEIFVPRDQELELPPFPSAS